MFSGLAKNAASFFPRGAVIGAFYTTVILKLGLIYLDLGGIKPVCPQQWGSTLKAATLPGDGEKPGVGQNGGYFRPAQAPVASATWKVCIKVPLQLGVIWHETFAVGWAISCIWGRHKLLCFVVRWSLKVPVLATGWNEMFQILETVVIA